MGPDLACRWLVAGDGVIGSWGRGLLIYNRAFDRSTWGTVHNAHSCHVETNLQHVYICPTQLVLENRAETKPSSKHQGEVAKL